VIYLLQHFPTIIRAGLNLESRILPVGEVGSDWTVRAHMRGPAELDLTAVWDGAAFVFSVPGGESASWTAGDYGVSVRASLGASVVELDGGSAKIVADLTSAPEGHDPRGHAEKVLASIEAVLEGRASMDQMSYTINGRTLVRTPIADLVALRKTYKAEVAAAKRGGRPSKLLGRKVRVRM
jgi:hypothetical protein